MASNPDLVQYICDQCSDAGIITSKLMFGDYGLYCDGKIFGLVSDNKFFVKPTKAGENVLRSEVLEPPYTGAKSYFYIEELDDREYLSKLIRETCKELPFPKPKKKKS